MSFDRTIVESISVLEKVNKTGISGYAQSDEFYNLH